MTLWCRVMFNEKSYVLYHSRKNALFHGPSLTIVCQWGNFGALLPPRGTTYTPLRGYVLAQLDNLFICGDLHVSTKFSLGATTRQSWPQCIVYAIFRPIFRTHVRSSYARSLIKVIARHSSIGRTIDACFVGLWQTVAGGVARQNLYGRRRIIISTQHNTSDALPSASTTN